MCTSESFTSSLHHSESISRNAGRSQNSSWDLSTYDQHQGPVPEHTTDNCRVRTHDNHVQPLTVCVSLVHRDVTTFLLANKQLDSHSKYRPLLYTASSSQVHHHTHGSRTCPYPAHCSATTRVCHRRRHGNAARGLSHSSSLRPSAAASPLRLHGARRDVVECPPHCIELVCAT
jgi:hypothetical protein